jgi:hypothetical protein
MRKQMGKLLILGDGSEGLTHLHVDIASGIGGTSYANGFLRDREPALRLEGHLAAPVLVALFQRLLDFSLLAS